MYLRSEALAKHRDKELQEKQKARIAQIEQELLEEIEKHEMLSVHNRNKRKAFTIEGKAL